jgi:hypothetical protein
MAKPPVGSLNNILIKYHDFSKETSIIAYQQTTSPASNKKGCPKIWTALHTLKSP